MAEIEAKDEPEAVTSGIEVSLQVEAENVHQPCQATIDRAEALKAEGNELLQGKQNKGRMR